MAKELKGEVQTNFKPNWMFKISFFFTLFGSPLLGYMKGSVEMGLAIVSGAICMAFANIEKFESFKGAGFEAKLKKKIHEAEEIMDHMRELAANLVKNILYSIATGSRFVGIGSLDRRIAAKEELLDFLRKLKIAQNKIDRTTEVFDGYIIRDHLNKIQKLVPDNDNIYRNIKHEIDKLLSQTSQEELSKIKQNQIRELLGNVESLTKNETLNDRLKDLEYFIENRKLRRPEAGV